MKTLRPVKRDENLVWLSRDHHLGLLLAGKIRKGLTNETPLQQIASYLQFASAHALHPHFRDEERLLFAMLDEQDCKRCLAEAQHQYIRQLVDLITDHGKHLCPAIFLELCDEIERHIRFEENILFPYIEKKLGTHQLNSIGWQLEQSHAASFRDDWPHPFWKL